MCLTVIQYGPENPQKQKPSLSTVLAASTVGLHSWQMSVSVDDGEHGSVVSGGDGGDLSVVKQSVSA